ncbi:MULTISPECIES: cytochrome b [Stappiaceae]|uniref:cytochrome b n=1 Tax=Stappiaceae TaxID=2821832 RepID=UPI000B8BC513|nr:cytochrome b [Labrenzia sp. VG12]ASP35823.1 cytochrome B [Labrenzia sp. VG12]
MARSEERYSLVARAIHWLTALMVLTMVPAGLVMIRIDGGALQNQLFDFHRSVGIVLMILTVFRLAYRLTHKPAPLPDSMPGWQKLAASATHVFLYGFLLINPFLGWVATSAYGAKISVFGLFTMPAIVAKDRALSEQLFQIHLILGLLFTLAVLMHIAAALYHGFIRRDGVLSRMV